MAVSAEASACWPPADSLSAGTSGKGRPLRVPDPVSGENVPIALPERRKAELEAGAAKELVAAALVASTGRPSVSHRGLGQAHLARQEAEHGAEVGRFVVNA